MLCQIQNIWLIRHDLAILFYVSWFATFVRVEFNKKVALVPTYLTLPHPLSDSESPVEIGTAFKRLAGSKIVNYVDLVYEIQWKAALFQYCINTL